MKSILRKTIIIFLLAIVSSCDKVNDPAPISFFELTSDAYYYFGYNNFSEGWVYATSKTGEILDIEKIVVNQKIILESKTLIEKFDLTFCFIYKNPTNEGLFFRSLLDLNSGTKLDIKELNSLTIVNQTGVAEITTGTFSDPYFYFVDNPLTFSSGLTNLYSEGTRKYDTKYVKSEVFLPVSPSDVFISSYKGTEPVYCFVKKLKIGDKVSLDFTNDFKSYEHVIDLTSFPGTSYGTIMGYLKKDSKEVGYLLSDNNRGPGGTFQANPKKKIGYLSGFDYYKTQVSSSISNDEFISYFKKGSVNSSISIPTFKLEISDKKFSSFTYTFSNPFTVKTSTWTGYSPTNGLINWDVTNNSTSSSHSISIPDEIKQGRDYLDIGKLNYQSSEFYNLLDGTTYEGFIKEAFLFNFFGLTEYHRYYKR